MAQDWWPPFFVTDTPLLPDGASRCRRLIAAYQADLEAAMHSLEAQHAACRDFIETRSASGRGLAGVGALGPASLHGSLAGARAIEAQLQRRLDRTAKHWDVNIQALELLCRPPCGAVAALAAEAEPTDSDLVFVSANGSAGSEERPDSFDAGSRFVLVRPGKAKNASLSDTTNYDNPSQV